MHHSAPPLCHKLVALSPSPSQGDGEQTRRNSIEDMDRQQGRTHHLNRKEIEAEKDAKVVVSEQMEGCLANSANSDQNL